MFRTGQEVVCVGFPKGRSWWYIWNEFWHPYESPVIGHIYTLSNVYFINDVEVVELLELPEKESEYWYPGFYAFGFRPVVRHKTDISIFKRMLKETEAPVPVA